MNKKLLEEAEKIAESSTSHISELPLNFNFGMSSKEVESNLKSLISEGLISRPSYNYEYKYILKSGDTIPMDLNFHYHNDELYMLIFSLQGTFFSQELIKLIEEDITAKLDTTYNRFSYSEEEYEQNFMFTKWFKENQCIFLRSAYGTDIQYIDVPINKAVQNEENAKRMQEINRRIDREIKKNGVKVENSAWDSSVSQVKEYLMEYLKDPDSYESIGWSDVKEHDNGYTVRHIYRAKNSFGGYVRSDNLFYLDLQGNVTNVVPFNE
ncbi:hypothetical protein [Pradoshia sp.]